jgi:hypothetical protein
MIYKLFYLALPILLIVSCNTNPPTSPDVTPTGNVVLTLKVDNTAIVWLVRLYDKDLQAFVPMYLNKIIEVSNS